MFYLLCLRRRKPGKTANQNQFPQGYLDLWAKVTSIGSINPKIWKEYRKENKSKLPAKERKFQGHWDFWLVSAIYRHGSHLCYVTEAPYKIWLVIYM